MSIEVDLLWVQGFLDKPKWKHLQCNKRGNSIAVFSMDEYGRWNRCRFTLIGRGQYALDFSNRNGKWDPTFFEGTVQELMEMIAEKFPWILTV